MALEYTLSSWPQYKDDVKLAARELYSVKDDLSEFDGLLVRATELSFHTYSGKTTLVVKCRERANECVWWLCMGKEIKDMISKCKTFIEKKPSRR